MLRKKLIITWGLGYIGSHTAVEAVKQWYDILIIDDCSNSDIRNLDNIIQVASSKEFWVWHNNFTIKFLKKSINDLELDDFSGSDYFGCINFAWKKAVGESCAIPFEYYENNIVWMLNLLKILEAKDIKNFIFSSSATVYEWDWIFSETDRLWCGNPYWTTKLMWEQILKDLSLHKGFNVWILRYFNPIGAHDSLLLWEKPDSPNNLLPILIENIVWKRDKVIVFGNDYDTRDWTWERDYIGINDLVVWHFKMLYKLIDIQEKGENNYLVYNLWVGRGLTVLEMIRIVEKVSWKQINFQIKERRPWDKGVCIAIPDKAKLELGFECKDDFHKIIKNHIDYYTKS